MSSIKTKSRLGKVYEKGGREKGAGADTHFKLYATGKITVEVVCRAGPIEMLDVSPKSPKKDVVLPQW